MPTAKPVEKTIIKASEARVLRPASLVMSEVRAGAACPNALSFSRNLLRKMCRENWRIETVRLDLDQDGRGEALYRIDAVTRTFHFFVLSDYFPPDQKIDRAFGINWDVSAAICQGEWTPEREARLRVEILKQYDGRYDSDVLCFCRGNRSERIFEHVVETLTHGRQPDVGMLASVGYLLRSTAFAGNGLFGMRPFDALGADHALGGTYEVQMLAAYMLRSFVFDLAEAIARQRSGSAVPIDRRLKRYLGIGNSAGLGLIPFVTNHPLIVNRWCLTHEQAFAEALARDACDGDVAARFMATLERACAYFGAEERDGNGIFADYATLQSDLERTLEAARRALSARQERPVNWRDVLIRSIPGHAHAETTELLYGIVLELYPDIVERHETRLQIEGSAILDPDMKASELAAILTRDYAWALEMAAEVSCDRFWYYPQESPYEPRRGVRGKYPALQTETTMDVPLMVTTLDQALREAEPDSAIAVLLAQRPDLVAIVTRVQALQGAPYAELRMNSLCASFQPFAACRFILAFYGMEKYDPRLPRSTKGALMQGAPLADEIGAYAQGDWPFPLPPDLASDDVRTLSTPPLRMVEQPEISIKDLALPARKRNVHESAGDALPIFLQEHHKMVMRLAQRAGLPYGTAVEVADAALFSAATGQEQVPTLLDFLARTYTLRPRLEGSDTLVAGGVPAFSVVPRAIDLASAQAGSSCVGWVKVEGAAPSPLLFAMPLPAAGRGNVVAVADSASGKLHLAGPGRAGPWIATVDGLTPAWTSDQGVAALSPASDAVVSMGRLVFPATVRDAEATPVLHVACLRLLETPASIEDRTRALLDEMQADTARMLASETVRDLRHNMIRNGVMFTHEALQALQAASMESLLPEEVEKQVAIPA